MENPLIENNNIGTRGQAIYDLRLRPLVETPENIGKLIVIDVNTESYEIAEEGLVAGKRLRQRFPDARMLCLRIGYDAVYSLGGELVRKKA